MPAARPHRFSSSGPCSRAVLPLRRAAAAFLLALAACSPAIDWREVHVTDGGTDLRVPFPCRPARVERALPLAGQPLVLALQSCEAGGLTVGLATAEVGNPAQVAPVLAALADGARRGLDAMPQATEAAAVPGATPGAVRLHLQGRRPDGSAVHKDVWLFSRGTRVYQATLVGSALAPADQAAFRDGLHFQGP